MLQSKEVAVLKKIRNREEGRGEERNRERT
jgi:hypothetical protein